MYQDPDAPSSTLYPNVCFSYITTNYPDSISDSFYLSNNVTAV